MDSSIDPSMDEVADIGRSLGDAPLGESEEDADAALEACAGGAGGYFRVDLPDGRKMVYLIRDHVPFGVQFGRQVMANLLGRPERMEWQACVLSDDEDTADAKAFREAFAPFNPVS